MQKRRSLKIGKAYGEAQALGLVLQGEKSQLDTRFFMAYTDDGFRVRIECAIGAPLRSAFEGESVPVWQADVVEVFLSPYGKEDWYYEFDFAPNGSFYHGHIYNPDCKTAYAHALDELCGVKADIQIRDGVWTTEMFIPFSAMELNKSLDEIKALPWRFNVYRIDDGGQEYCSFAPTYAQKINFHISSAFADLILE